MSSARHCPRCGTKLVRAYKNLGRCASCVAADTAQAAAVRAALAAPAARAAASGRRPMPLPAVEIQVGLGAPVAAVTCRCGELAGYLVTDTFTRQATNCCATHLAATMEAIRLRGGDPVPARRVLT